MNTNTTAQNTTADVIKSLTVKGRDAMTQIGLGRVSFFDGGIVEGEGSWGGCLVDDLGHKSSGVLNRLATLGLFDFTDADVQDDQRAGGWWTLTALGADVANTLAKETAAPRELTKEELAEVQRGIDLDTIAAELDTNPWDEKSPTTEETTVTETPAPAKKATPAKKAPAKKAAEKKAPVARRSEVLGTAEGKRIVKAKRYTVKEVAELLDASPISVNRWTQMGYLTVEKSDPKDGRVVNLIPGSSVAEFVKGRADRAKKAEKAKAEKAAKKATSSKK